MASFRITCLRRQPTITKTVVVPIRTEPVFRACEGLSKLGPQTTLNPGMGTPVTSPHSITGLATTVGGPPSLSSQPHGTVEPPKKCVYSISEKDRKQMEGIFLRLGEQEGFNDTLNKVKTFTKIILPIPGLGYFIDLIPGNTFQLSSEERLVVNRYHTALSNMEELEKKIELSRLRVCVSTAPYKEIYTLLKNPDASLDTLNEIVASYNQKIPSNRVISELYTGVPELKPDKESYRTHSGRTPSKRQGPTASEYKIDISVEDMPSLVAGICNEPSGCQVPLLKVLLNHILTHTSGDVQSNLFKGLLNHILTQTSGDVQSNLFKGLLNHILTHTSGDTQSNLIQSLAEQVRSQPLQMTQLTLAGVFFDHIKERKNSHYLSYGFLKPFTDPTQTPTTLWFALQVRASNTTTNRSDLFHSDTNRIDLFHSDVASFLSSYIKEPDNTRIELMRAFVKQALLQQDTPKHTELINGLIQQIKDTNSTDRQNQYRLMKDLVDAFLVVTQSYDPIKKNKLIDNILPNIPTEFTSMRDKLIFCTKLKPPAHQTRSPSRLVPSQAG